ncbi:hypothetical protein J2T13_003912 [Paenibacillus sp. DS2015]|uniref:hypothetical protein n=1 Tax=Paenibacillus sp. DS2015 TaxID=3373917 RepID=UPI003D1DA642
MKRVKAKPIMITGIILIFLLFGVWNLVWLIMTNNRYNGFLEAVPKSKFGNHTIKKDRDVYNVSKPGYLSFTGNLGINNPEEGYALIIWPLIKGGYEYGFRVQKEGKVYEFYLNEQLKPMDEDNKQVAKLVQEFKPEIAELFEKANSMWELE